MALLDDDDDKGVVTSSNDVATLAAKRPVAYIPASPGKTHFAVAYEDGVSLPTIMADEPFACR